MTIIPWTTSRKHMEARVYCPKCFQSNVVEAYDLPAFWDREEKLGWFSFPCDRCGCMIRIKKAKDGVHYMGTQL